MSNLASPGIFAVFVVFEHPDGRTLGAAVARMYQDMEADLVVFVGETKFDFENQGGKCTYLNVAYRERKEGEPPTAGTWHY